MHKKLFPLLSLALTLLTLTACSREDDIEEIFTGKTWYMNGAIINGMRLNSDVTNFYTDAGEGAYYITFSGSTFNGELSDGNVFSGTWSANGKNQTITLQFTTSPNADTVFDQQLRSVLTSISNYSSGADFLQLKKDGHNVLFLGNTRSRVIN